jgi:hypothetical protein
MRFTLSFIALVLIALSNMARADSLCTDGLGFDSYGAGLVIGYKGERERPARYIDSCLESGIERGRELAEGKGTVGVSRADEEFERGLANGFYVTNDSYGIEYYTAGYSAGLARLHSETREGKGTVGVKCLDEYARGFASRASTMAEMPPVNSRDLECYSTGRYDGRSDLSDFGL